MEGAPFVGDHSNDDNLLQKGRPLIMRLHSQPLPSAIAWYSSNNRLLCFWGGSFSQNPTPAVKLGSPQKTSAVFSTSSRCEEPNEALSFVSPITRRLCSRAGRFETSRSATGIRCSGLLRSLCARWGAAVQPQSQRISHRMCSQS